MNESPYVFLSYATVDRERALQIADALEQAGVHVWIDRRGLNAGDLWAAEITAAIRSSSAVALVCSEASVASRNVRQEIQLAWDNDRPIVPLMLEQVRFPDELAYFLQGRQWIDVPDIASPSWATAIAQLIAPARPGREIAENGGNPIPRTEFFQPAALPELPRSLIGRDQQVADVVTLIESDETRLVTLTGPGGVGKTRLALEIAHRVSSDVPGAVVLVDLAPISDPELVVSTIAQTLGISESGDRPLITSLCTAMASRKLLLFLDNFEQVIDAAAQVSDLLSGTSSLHVLVTSREALRIRGEHEVVVLPLEVPDERETWAADSLSEIPAVALFVETATSVKPEFALTNENARAVAEICRRLDGLPLAIELGATRVRHFSPELLLEHMQERLPMLTAGPRDLPARQQTLRDTIAWSYDLLSPSEQALFRRLGAFVGGATVPAIEAVTLRAGPLDIDLLSGLASLVEKSLLRETEGVNGAPRFWMLETIREFALAALLTDDESEPTLDGHAQYFAQHAETFGGFLATANQDVNLEQQEQEFDNIRAAFAWRESRGDANSCAHIAVSLYGFCYLWGLYSEGSQLFRRSLELAKNTPIDEELRGEVLSVYGHWLSILGDHFQGEVYAREGLEMLRRSLDYRSSLFINLIVMVVALREQNRFIEASEYAEEARQLAIDLAEKSLESVALYHVGKLAFLCDELELAEIALRRSIDLSHEVGVTVIWCYALTTLANVHTRREEFSESARRLREADQLLTETRSRGTAGSWLEESIYLAAAAGMPELAARLLGFSSSLNVSYGTYASTYPWMDEVIASIKQSIAVTEFESAYNIGASLSFEDGMAMARGLLDEFEVESQLRGS